MHRQKPRPEGFNSRIKFSREQCVKFEVNEALADVAATDWCDEKLMAKNVVTLYGSIFSSYCQKFLDTYCKNAIKYFKAENVISSFKDVYNKELEELKIQQLKSVPSLKGYRNAIAVTVQEYDCYYQEVSVSTTTDAFNGSHAVQHTTEFTSKDSHAAQETEDFVSEGSHAAQEISESIVDFTDSPLLQSTFRTNIFKAGYKYFKNQLSLFDIVNLDKMAKSVDLNSTG
ncbi:uncharacterized protein B0P05DRAFT_620142 [Gilbertella persicaria]|uniref:uncharacterized protein n=1 Tax=Gilbertella persicaria TaxID=101096 RepID=UPI00221E42A5|nr:uncharacterized protein B0P05DRAFT_620142 [Gilbertella persicaria]KAI8069826.1 hypothetical protein B0P05DRAFT_620142 [Gilbertella persicaria]